MSDCPHCKEDIGTDIDGLVRSFCELDIENQKLEARVKELDAIEMEILKALHIDKDCGRYTWSFHGIRYKTLAECLKVKTTIIATTEQPE